MTSIDLMEAVSKGQFRLCRILMEGGSDVNVKGEEGKTPLMLACLLRVDRHNQRKKMKLIQSIIEHGADLYARNDHGRSCMYYLECHGPSIISIAKRYVLQDYKMERCISNIDVNSLEQSLCLPLQKICSTGK